MSSTSSSSSLLDLLYSDILLYPMDRTFHETDYSMPEYLNTKLDVKEIRYLLEEKPYKALFDCYRANGEFRVSYIDLEEHLEYTSNHHDKHSKRETSDFVGRVITLYQRAETLHKTKMIENDYQIMGGCGIMLNRTTMVTSRELVKPKLVINGVEYVLIGVFTSLCRDLFYNHVHDLLELKKMKKAKIKERTFHPTITDPNDPVGLLVDGFVFLETDMIPFHGEDKFAIPGLYPQSGGKHSTSGYVVGYPIVEAEYQLKWKSIQEEKSSITCFNQNLVAKHDGRTMFCGGLTVEEEKLSFRTKPLYSNEDFNQFNENSKLDDEKYPSYLIQGSYPSFIGMTGSVVSDLVLNCDRWVFHSIHLGFVFKTDLLENVFTSNMPNKPFKKLSVAIRVDSLPFLMEYANLIKKDDDFIDRNKKELRAYFSKNEQLLIHNFPKLYERLFICPRL